MNSPRIRPDHGTDRGKPAREDSLKLGHSETAEPSAFSAKPASCWIIGRTIDLLFIANVLWPLFFFAQLAEGFVGRTGVQFWQVYFVTTPHRWITLAIVLLDREQFLAKRSWFLGIAALVVAICTTVRITTGTITCLLAIDYVWNAWHFAAQHHGVYRIYSRLGGGPSRVGGTVEKVSMRAFILYVIVRIAGGTSGSPSIEEAMRWADWFVALIPATLLIREIASFDSTRSGRAAYLVSVSALYASLLWAVHERRPALVLSLATASALFHAIEYLAIVGWSVRKRHAERGGMIGMLSWFAPRWGIALTLFVVILGSAAWMMDRQLLEVWLFINVIVAFLHYAYDGLIWKRPRRPASTAPIRQELVRSPELQVAR